MIWSGLPAIACVRMRASVFVFFRLSIVTRAPSLCIYKGNCGYRGLRHSSRDRHHATVYGSGVGLRRYSVFIIRDSPQHAAAKHRGGSTKTGRWRAAFTATALELSSANLLFFVPCRCCCCTMEPEHCSWMDSPVREGAALCSPFSGGKPRPRWFTLVFCLPITMAWCLLWILLIVLYAIVSAQNNAVGKSSEPALAHSNAWFDIFLLLFEADCDLAGGELSRPSSIGRNQKPIEAMGIQSMPLWVLMSLTFLLSCICLQVQIILNVC